MIGTLVVPDQSAERAERNLESRAREGPFGSLLSTLGCLPRGRFEGGGWVAYHTGSLASQVPHPLEIF